MKYTEDNDWIIIDRVGVYGPIVCEFIFWIPFWLLYWDYYSTIENKNLSSAILLQPPLKPTLLVRE
jgi:hypothetical protein